jgi:serine protease Do
MSLRKVFLVSSPLVLLIAGAVLAQTTPRTPQTAQTPRTPETTGVLQLFANGDSFLGVYSEDITRENMSRYNLREPRGVGVTRVAEGSPAEKAGLKKNDVILKFDGETVNSVRKLNRVIGESTADHVVRLTISRNGSEQEVSATLAKREGRDRLFDLRSDVIPNGDWTGTFGGLTNRLDNMKIDSTSLLMSLGTSRRIRITTEQLTKQLAEYFGVTKGTGLLVTSVSEDGPAAKAGLKAGDVITEVEGAPVESVSDLIRELNRKTEGDVSLTIIRDKSQRTIKVTPEKGRDGLFELEGLGGFPKIGAITIPRINVRVPTIRPLVIPTIKFTMPKVRVSPKVIVRPILLD